jgi:hypothetical protein
MLTSTEMGKTYSYETGTPLEYYINFQSSARRKTFVNQVNFDYF